MSSEIQDLWIDTDIIFNRFGEDVDDGLALMMALDHPGVRVHGISLVGGVDNGYRVTQRLLKHYAPYSVPVYKGSAKPEAGPGVCTPAVDQLAAALRQQPMRILAIGTATNLANLLLFHPDAAANIQDIVLCAGRQAGVNFTVGKSDIGLPDANFDNDPASMQQLMESGIPISLCGFEASQNIWLDGHDIKRIRKNGRPGDRWVARRLSLWRLGWLIRLRLGAFIPFDACTLGYMLYPESFKQHSEIPLQINTRPNDAPLFKKLANKPYLEVSRNFSSAQRVNFVYQAAPSFKQHLMHHLLGRS